MNLLKSKKFPKPRTLKGIDQDMEGSTQNKGYDSETQDEDVIGLVRPKKGLGDSSKKKKKNVEVDDFDWDRESDFVEEIVRDHFHKRSGGKGKGKACHYERVSPSSDNEPLAQWLGRKGKTQRRQEDTKKNEESNNEECDEQGIMYGLGDKTVGGRRASKGFFDNPGSMLREIGILKHQM